MRSLMNRFTSVHLPQSPTGAQWPSLASRTRCPSGYASAGQTHECHISAPGTGTSRGKRVHSRESDKRLTRRHRYRMAARTIATSKVPFEVDAPQVIGLLTRLQGDWGWAASTAPVAANQPVAVQARHVFSRNLQTSTLEQRGF